MATYRYDPNGVIFAYGPLMVADWPSGLLVDVDLIEEMVEVQSGCDGEVEAFNSLTDAALVRVRVMATDPMNGFLSLYRSPSKIHEVSPLFCIHRGTADAIFSPRAKLIGFPSWRKSSGFDRDAKGWLFLARPCRIIHGGSPPVGGAGEYVQDILRRFT